jgi:hypothetical protein
MAAGSLSGGDLSSTVLAGHPYADDSPTSNGFLSFVGFVPGQLIEFTFDLERQALVDLYDDTNGDDWTNNDNWKSNEDLILWQGIITENNRVTTIFLEDNNLKGTMPQAVADLPFLSEVDISGNEVTAVPDLSAVTTVDIRDNKLNFDQIIPNLGGQYDPQKTIGEASADTIFVGENFTFDQNGYFSNPDNAYSWSFNGDELSGENNANLTVENIDFGKMGTYGVSVTNPSVPGLILTSEARVLLAKGDLAVTATDFNDNDIGPGVAATLLTELTGAGFDSTNVVSFTDGTFVIPEVVLGDYLVGIEAEDSDLIPSYYIATFLWEEADTLEMRERNQEISITVSPDPDALQPGDGDGVISGVLEEDFEELEDGRTDARRRAANRRCHVRRRTRAGKGDGATEDEFVLIVSLDTDENGEFTIAFLPPGTYRINFEYPGIPMDQTSFVQFEINEQQNNLRLAAIATDDGIVVENVTVLAAEGPEKELLKIYPNPSLHTLHVRASAEILAASRQLRLLDLQGKQVLASPFNKENTDLDMRALHAGLYILEIVDEKGEVTSRFKILKN